ncbi:MAG: NAD(P)/FAD-dependent oxidoreductase [Gammaproteobacteria bacterium]|nr:NAD(P)/FAD-dependent oxidoreductase [Gammaproteobacteria bacterium]
MQHLIIGAGPAGVVAAEHIRKLDKHCSITLIGDEPEPPYSRMAIPYFLVGNIAEQGTYLRKTEGDLASKGIEVRHAKVTAVKPADKQVTLDNGSTLGYDKLLLCTGSHPVQPPIEGMNLPQVHSCWTLQDARSIIELANPGSRVVLMGAGFIGCIILEALALRKVDLTVVEMDNRMVPRMMNETTGGMIKQWCEDKGVKVFTSTRVSAVRKAKSGFFRKSAHALNVDLDNKQTLEADLVISATGVRSNTEFLQGSGLKLDQGVVVDDYLQTSDPAIYAAGDVAQGRDFSTGDYTVQAIQPTAVEHGKLAATNMVRGNTVRHQGSVNMNVLDTLGLISTSFGSWMGVEGGEQAEICDVKNYKYLNLQFQGDVLVGASSLGMTDHMGVLRGLIQSKTRLGVWKQRLMKDPMRIMEAYLAMAQAQSTAAKV